MSLRSLIDQAIEKAGSQVKLAEQMKVQQQVISAWRTGRRIPQHTADRAVQDRELRPKAALLEQVVEGLDENDT
jgi:ribosome-binding protein aMBF1 (putative translation factor)